MKYGSGVGYSNNFKLPEYRIKPGIISRIPPNLPIVFSFLVIAVMLVLGIFHILSWGLALVISGVIGIAMSVLALIIPRLRMKNMPPPDREAILKKKLIVKNKETGNITQRLVFEHPSGAIYNLNLDHQEDVFQYYNVGDRVCVHGGYSYPEKYEKLFDDKIICISCGHLYHTQKDKCGICRLTLLK